MASKLLFASAVCLIILIAGGLFVYSRQISSGSGKQALQVYADEVIAACSSQDFPPHCYDEEIPKLMDRISLEESFEVVRLIQQKDERYLYCHVVSHKISFAEAAKNPAGWKDVITRCPTTFCNNGCLHGALMQRFNAEYLSDAQIESIMPDLESVCEPRGDWNPVRVEMAMCYHAIGHLLMFATKADITKSLHLCEKIGEKPDGRNYVETCTYGVLMTVFQPLEPEDFALVRHLTPPKERVDSFCDKFRGVNKYSWHGCRRESWPLFNEELWQPEGLVKFCSYTNEPEWQRRCYSMQMNIINTQIGVSKNDINAVREYCKGMPDAPRIPESPRELCFAFSAQQLVQLDPQFTDEALETCKAAAKLGIGDACYKEMAYFGYASFHPGSEPHQEYCGKLPEPWATTCRDLR